MRILALATLFMMASCSWGTVSHRCADGTYVEDTGTPDCPTRLYEPSPGAGLSDTGTDTTTPITQTGGTGYWCLYPSANAAPSFDQLVAATDGTDAACTASGNETVTAAPWSTSATGLTASTTYRAAQGVLRNGKRSAVSVSPPFTTLEGGGAGGLDLTGTGYFVDCDAGSDSNTGLSDAQAWLTLTKVNSSVTAIGSNVYIKAGTTCDDQKLVADWGGTSGDWAEVSGYYMDGAATPKESTSAQPPWSVNGKYTAAQYSDGDVQYTSGTLNCNPECSQYEGAIRITANYTRVAWGRVSEWASRAVDISGRAFVKVEDMEFFNIGFQAVVIENNSSDIVVRRNDVQNYTHCHTQKSMSGTGSETLCPAPYGSAIIAARNPGPTYGRILVEGNDIRGGSGEGIDCIAGTDHMIIRGNRISNLASTPYYFDVCDNSVVENNIAVLETGSGDFSGDIGYVTNAPRFGELKVSWEDHLLPNYSTQGYTNNLFRNNLLVNTGSCAALAMETGARAAGRKVAGAWYHNACIDPHFSTVSQQPTSTSNLEVAEIRYEGNVFYDTLGASSANAIAGTFDNNFWTTTQNDADVRDAGDVQDSNPDFTNTQSLAAWVSSYGSGTWPTFADVEPLAASPLVSAASASCVSEAFMESDDFGFAFDQIAEVLAATLTGTNWEKGCAVDALNNTRVNDIGPVEYTP